MKFSLSKYLTEKLQSSTIVNELLNDKGGFFKIYKAYNYTKYNNNHYFDRLIEIKTKMYQMFGKLHGETYDRNIHKYVLYRKADDRITDEKYIKAHTEYMKLYNEYIKLAKRIFTTPSSELLSLLLAGELNSYSDIRSIADLANITDNMFKKYTFKELKKDTKAYNTLQYSGIIFFMRNDKTILAYMRNGELYMFNYPIYNTYFKNNSAHIIGDDSLEKLQSYTQEPENFVFQTIECDIDGQTYSWPVIWKSYEYRDTQKEGPDVVSIVKDKLSVSLTYSYNSDNGPMGDHGSCGKFLHKGSTLYKRTHWGDNPDDYIIVFNPMKTFGSKTRDYFNGLRNSNYNKEHVRDVDAFVYDRYTWVRDMYGDILPYGGTKEYKSSKVYKFLQTFDEWTYNSAYQADRYCKKMRDLNSKKYSALKELCDSMKKTQNVFKKELDNDLKELNDHIQFSQEVSAEISILSTSSNKISEKLQKLSSRYATYQFFINECMIVLNNIMRMIQKVTNTQDNLQKDILSMSPTSDTYWVDARKRELSNDNTNISDLLLHKVISYLNTLRDAKDNLKQILEQNES